MKESAEIAYSYVTAHLKDFKGDPNFFDQALVHLHVPEGATPKDGPSAGITMASALLSLARNQAPKKNVAMTGELTLTGQVLPIGGVREKVIAARRQKISELILPEPNRGDFEELPAYLKEGLTVHFAKRFATWPRCSSSLTVRPLGYALRFAVIPGGFHVQPSSVLRLSAPGRL